MMLQDIAKYIINYINAKIEQKFNELFTENDGELIDITKPKPELKVIEIKDQVAKDEI